MGYSNSGLVLRVKASDKKVKMRHGLLLTVMITVTVTKLA